jgi:LPXTG-motif cell wall-anchored protein
MALAAGVGALAFSAAGVAAGDTGTSCSGDQSVTAQGYCSPVTTPTTTTPSTPSVTTTSGGGTAPVTTTTGAVLGATTSASGTPAAPGGSGGSGASPATHTSGTAAAHHTISSTAPLQTVRRSGTLPFTGIQLTIFALVGLALIAGGYLLHRTGRRRGSDA